MMPPPPPPSAPSSSMGVRPGGNQPRAGAAGPSNPSAAHPGRQQDPLAGYPKYQKLEDLSSGAFGFVQRAKVLSPGPNEADVVAIKFIERGERVNRYVEAEILNHRMLRHPHVIEFKEVFLTPDYICIAMEFASGGNLFNYVKRAGHLKEAAARWFFQQLIIGLDYCHRRGVVNRDIKLENTLLQMVPNLPLPLIKICDFGYSKAHFMSAPKSKVGTLAYMAPEVIRSTGNYNGDLADIWSCGVMLYVMLFGQYPFDASAAAAAVNMANGAGADQRESRVQQQINRIMSMQWTIPSHVVISEQCRSLLSRLLVLDPARRITMAQIQADPWFRSNLPVNALSMNDNFLENTDYTGVQTVEDIQAILQMAQTPGPSRHQFNTEEEEFELIEEAIQDDLAVNATSFDPVGRHGGQPVQARPGPSALSQPGPLQYVSGMPMRPATVTSVQYSSIQLPMRPAVVTSAAGGTGSMGPRPPALSGLGSATGLGLGPGRAAPAVALSGASPSIISGTSGQGLSGPVSATSHAPSVSMGVSIAMQAQSVSMGVGQSTHAQSSPGTNGVGAVSHAAGSPAPAVQVAQVTYGGVADGMYGPADARDAEVKGGAGLGGTISLV